MVLARRGPGGMVVLPARPRLAIPASLRRRCGLRPGNRVLLAAPPCQIRAGGTAADGAAGPQDRASRGMPAAGSSLPPIADRALRAASHSLSPPRAPRDAATRPGEAASAIAAECRRRL